MDAILPTVGSVIDGRIDQAFNSAPRQAAPGLTLEDQLDIVAFMKLLK